MVQLSPQAYVLKKLNEAFAQAKAKNPRFSLRGLAVKTGLSAGYLNKIFNGKRDVTRTAADKILRGLDVTTFERRQIIFDIPLATGKRIIAESEAGNLEYQKFTREDMISFAKNNTAVILSLVGTKNFKEDYEWIGRRVGVSPEAAKAAIDILLKMEFVSRNEIGNLYTIDNLVKAESILGDEESAFENLIKRVDFIRNKLTEYKNGEEKRRLYTRNTTYRVDPSRVDQAYGLINTFDKDMAQILEASDDCDEVYYLNVNFVPATNIVE